MKKTVMAASSAFLCAVLVLFIGFPHFLTIKKIDRRGPFRFPFRKGHLTLVVYHIFLKIQRTINLLFFYFNMLHAVTNFLLAGGCDHQPIKNPLSCWNSEEQDRGMSHFLGK